MFKKEDIRIDLKYKKFKFRVAGIVISNGKILVDKMRNNDFYCFPGGHVEVCEDTRKAAIRELKEELYFKFKIKNLLFIHENFFNAHKKKFHELCFYYLVCPTEKDFKPRDIIFSEIDNNEQLFHDYRWIELSDLKETDVRPKVIFERLNHLNTCVTHIISKEGKNK